MSRSNTEKTVKDIPSKTRRKHSAEEKMPKALLGQALRIALEGLRGEISIAEPCRREGISSNSYNRWSKGFLAAGEMPFPAVLKTAAQGVAHKSDVDGLVLNIQDKAGLLLSYEEMAARLGPGALGRLRLRPLRDGSRGRQPLAVERFLRNGSQAVGAGGNAG